MSIFSKTFSTVLVAALMFAGVTTSALGQGTGGGGGPSSGVSSAGPKGLIKLRATVVCASCSLDEAKAAHPDMTDLYELTHEKGMVVIRVISVNDPSESNERGDVSNRWTSIGQPPKISVRAEDNIFQKLVDAKNRSKEVEITGIIRTTRTLDVSEVTVLG